MANVATRAHSKQTMTKCRDLWSFCENPICPYPVWKSVRRDGQGAAEVCGHPQIKNLDFRGKAGLLSFMLHLSEKFIRKGSPLVGICIWEFD